ncbi:hypothetical protein CHU32_22010 [Superficieibacter electus]|uniref:Type 1 fimbrial protein n=1 Tax=Superficieibacter electus TaxID=2022662 RepID=A0A2P5GJR9_9ENTR|nr:type 1 fimbrial protein [Superficieibacter electus]POP41936.1 hypothetical protein CHU33_21540 [Superficieibacter electus]POP44241.1 hypothetical protein CHU32_22010 [Superficieibacter electus]
MKLSDYIIISAQAAVAAFSINTFAGEEATGGIIHFQGQVVEPPCEVTHNTHNINVSCVREGKTQHFRQSLNHQPLQEVSNTPFEKTTLEYLNPERTLGLYIIQYR